MLVSVSLLPLLPRRLTSPQRRDDAKFVGALVFKMLQFMETETGGWVRGVAGRGEAMLAMLHRARGS